VPKSRLLTAAWVPSADIYTRLIPGAISTCIAPRSILEGHAVKLQRRQFVHLAAGAAALPAAVRIAWAQTYPTRPITVIDNYAAGGITDVTARIVTEPMRTLLGQPIIVENVTGADGKLGTGRAARATADGYTITFGSISTHVLNGAFYSLPYNVLNDFAPISPLVTVPFILFARRNMLAKDLNELIDWLKANANKASMGVVSTTARLMAAFFQKETGTQFTLVPYRGTVPAIQDLVPGQIDLAIGTPLQLPLVRAGSMKAYAVTSDARLAHAPDIPTFAEMGLPALSFSGWGGFFAPKGTSRDIIAKLNAAVVEALADGAVRSRLTDLGEEIFPRDQQTPEALGRLVKADAEKWWPIIKELRIKVD
jgi:tripartite-type tricarboxylate transporter receptor subunit TctC